MINTILKKSLVLGIILLFVATGIVPTIAQDVEKPSLPISRGNWLYVGGNGPGNYTTVQSAINAANPGDTIYVFSGVYHENLDIGKDSISSYQIVPPPR